MDIERLAADELERIDRHRNALEELRDNPTFVRLQDTRLTGDTKRRWDAASAAVMSATSRLAKSRDIVSEAIRLLLANPPDPRAGGAAAAGPERAFDPGEMPTGGPPPPASSSSALRFSLVPSRTSSLKTCGRRGGSSMTSPTVLDPPDHGSRG